MKKKLAGLLTMLMVLSMGMTAFAAQSPGNGNSSNSSGSGSSTTQTPATPSAPQGTTEVTPVSPAVEAAAESVAKSVSPNAQVMAVVDVTYDGAIPPEGIQISFSLAGVQPGDNYVLLHQLKDGRWEMITPDSIENGVISATFTSLSPVAFVKLPPAQNDGNTDPNGTANGTSTKPNGTTTSTSGTAAGSVAASPKTGAALPVLPVLAMICVAGIVVCGRKVKFNA